MYSMVVSNNRIPVCWGTGSRRHGPRMEIGPGGNILEEESDRALDRTPGAVVGSLHLLLPTPLFLSPLPSPGPHRTCSCVSEDHISQSNKNP